MDRNTRRRRSIIIITAVLLIFFAGLFIWAKNAAEESQADQTEAIRDSIRRRALQCYVIEGAYPESLDYLVDNYGLAVNREDYRIIYKAYAENMPPDIRVIYTGGK